jgi:hypothetical protein
MKVLFSIFVVIIFFLFNSCKSDSNPTSGGGFGGPGGGGGGGVTFTITQGPGNQGGIIFYASPSTAVTVNNVNYSVVNSTTKGDIPGNTTTVYPANQPVSIGEFNATAGLKYVFIFTGTLGSATGTAYTATSNYTVQ